MPMSIMTDSDAHKEEATVACTDKPTKPNLVDIRNGRLVLKQKILSFEKMSETMQEIVKFREMIEQRLERKEPPLGAVPDEHQPLIAKLVHESDKTLQALSKHVQGELLPVYDEDDSASEAATVSLGVEVVEKAINLVATRNNYGLESLPGATKVPASLSIWRWEVKDEYKDWLPKAAKEKVEIRWAERRQAREDAKALFASLPEEERNAMLGGRNTARAPLKAKSSAKSADDPIIIDESEAELKPPSQQSNKKRTKHIENLVEEQSGTTPKARQKKAVDVEKAAKEKERQEKKAAKVEREKKAQDAQAKSRSIMANFFGKAKAPSLAGSSSTNKDSSPGVAGPSSTESNFEKSFKSFVVKKDAELAPVNWFRHLRKRSTRGKERMERNVIVLDDFDDEIDKEQAEDIVMSDALESDPMIGQLSPEERLHDVLSHLPPSLHPVSRRRRPISHLKTYSPHSVRAIMSQLNEAEIAGDDVQVRSLLALLRDRSRIPVKVLIFAEDARPGYFGTWTRTSREVGPRAPFARDIVSLDYTYDSGEEWEEESGEADDVVDDAEEDDAGEEEDSDLESWLVDDDEVEDPGTPIENRAGSPDVFLMDAPVPAAAAPKRKVEEEKTKRGKKRKVVVPLVPFTKGPCWESKLGECSYEPFNPYRIQLFNDTPYPIDPFTFVSAAVEKATAASAKEHPASDPRFVLPALPSHLSASPASGGTSLGPKRSTLVPKTAFPEVHLPLLLTRISTLATSSLQYIVETVHQELREQRVKKNAIEAKVREVGEKCKTQKIWVLKPHVKEAHGLVT